MLTPSLAALNDPEGPRVPAGLPPVVDAHVQCFDMHSAALDAVCQVCADEGKPLVIHAGREPKSPAYRCDPHRTCSAAKVKRLLENFPRLALCVPHLGADEFRAYQRLLERHDTLWLDTAMALTDYLPFENRVPLAELRPDRVMYGSDFPSIPYAWDRELKWLREARLNEEHLEALLAGNARQFLGIGAGGRAATGSGGP